MYANKQQKSIEYHLEFFLNLFGFLFIKCDILNTEKFHRQVYNPAQGPRNESVNGITQITALF